VIERYECIRFPLPRKGPGVHGPHQRMPGVFYYGKKQSVDRVILIYSVNATLGLTWVKLRLDWKETD